MGRLSIQERDEREDALLAAIKKVNAEPAGYVVWFEVGDYTVPFLRALQTYANSRKAPRKGADGTYRVYRARLVTQQDGAKRVPIRLEISHVWCAPRQ